MISRGSVSWVDLGPIVDHALAKRRPVLVVQSDAYTRTRLGTVVVIALSSRTARAAVPGNVFLPASATGLPKDSVALTTEVLTLDLERLGEPVASIPSPLMRDIDAGLRRVLEL